jgi:hypothetical protein
MATLTGITFSKYFYFTGMCEETGIVHDFRARGGYSTIQHSTYSTLQVNQHYRLSAVIPIVS